MALATLVLGQPAIVPVPVTTLIPRPAASGYLDGQYGSVWVKETRPSPDGDFILLMDLNKKFAGDPTPIRTNYPFTLLNTYATDNHDYMLRRITQNGTVVWQTFLNNMQAHDIEVDVNDYIYLVGKCNATFPDTIGNIQPTQDAALLILKPDGTKHKT